MMKRSDGLAACHSPSIGLVSASTSRTTSPARRRNSSHWCHWMRRDSRCRVTFSQRRLLNGVCRILRGRSKCTTTGTASSASPNRAAGASKVMASAAAAGAAVEIRGQGLIVRLARVDEVVIDVQLGEALAVVVAELLYLANVVIAQAGWVDLHFLAGLHVAKQSGPLEREIELGGILYVEDDDVVAMAGEQPQRLERFGRLVDEVADDDDEAAPLELADGRAQAGSHVGDAGRRLAHHGGHELAQVRAP